MITKLIGHILGSTSLGFSLVFIAMNGAYASEVIDPSEISTPEATNATQLSPDPIEVSLQDETSWTAKADHAEVAQMRFQPWTDATVETVETAETAETVEAVETAIPDSGSQQWQVSEIPIAAVNLADVPLSGAESIAASNIAANSPVEANPFENNQSENNQSENNQSENNQSENNLAPEAIASLSLSPALNPDSTISSPAIDFIQPETDPSFSTLSSSELAQLTTANWQVSQGTAEPASNPPASPSEAREPAATPWRFTFAPYGFVPLTTTGSVTVRDFTADIDVGLDDLLDVFNFALAGRFEAWHGNLGLIFDGSYFNLGQDNSRSRDCRGCFKGILPSEINTEINVQYGQFDLGVGYRIATANPAAAATDFDLGPLVFDAFVGARIYVLYQEINLSTNLGTERNLDQSNTLIEPLVSGRFRWNVSPKLAGWVRGDLAGFGIGGTLMAASVTGGIDWMFSGNTSLLLAYRFSSLQYNTEVGGQDFDLNLLLQGPYMGVVFRF